MSDGLAIEMRPIGSIRPYPNNPRKIGRVAVARVAASLDRFGWRQPIVVDAAGVIVAGHTRYRAAKSLRFEIVPVHVAADLSAEAVAALRLADNKLGELVAWDDEVLADEVRALESAGVEGLAELVGETWLEEHGGRASLFFVTVRCPDEARQRAVYQLLGEAGIAGTTVRVKTVD